MSQKQRENWIDFVKFVAIFVVLLNHSQWDVPGVKFWGGMFFVPVFFVLSGYTHHSREESFVSLVKRKAKRLLLPYIVANGILFVFFWVKDVVVGTKAMAEMLPGFWGIFYARNQVFAVDNQTLFIPKTGQNIYLMTNLNSPTWFLAALFVVIVLFEALVRLCKKDGRKMLLVAVVMLCLANLYHYLFPLLLPWSLDAMPYFLIMFLWGYFMAQKEYMKYFDSHIWVLLLVVALFVVSALINGSANYSVGMYGTSAMLALYNGIVSSTVLMYLCRKINKWIPGVLAMVGRQTMVILCYHLLVFSIIETLVSGIWPMVTIVVTMVLLTAVGRGKEMLFHAKK